MTKPHVLATLVRSVMFHFIRTQWLWGSNPSIKAILFLWLVLWLPGEKLLWFQGQLDPEKMVYTRKDACDIIERSKIMLILSLVSLSSARDSCKHVKKHWDTLLFSEFVHCIVQVPPKVWLWTGTDRADEWDQRSAGSSPWCQRGSHQTDHWARASAIWGHWIRWVLIIQIQACIQHT